MNESIQKKLSSLPEKPGVYIMKDAGGAVIYVGKAKILKNRVKSYFTATHDSLKTYALVNHIDDFEYIITASETEAYILENSLIKKHRPRYNIMFKDDKTYPFIKLTAAEAFPRLTLVRKAAADKNEYFGPYADQWSVRVIMRLTQDIFNVRSCSFDLSQPRKKPCLQYHIGRCKAPCVGYISAEEYSEIVKNVRKLLRGDCDGVVAELERKMAVFSKNFKFEQAAKARDQIISINNIAKRQNIVCHDLRDRDFIAEACGTILNVIEVFNVRNGALLGRKTFVIDGEKITERSALDEFIAMYYQNCEAFPDEIILPETVLEETRAFLKEYAASRHEKKIRVTSPETSEQSELLALVHKNALNSLKIKEIEKTEKDVKSRTALAEITSALGLTEAPRRIECYDISNISGTLAVGSMVVAIEGAMDHSEYRKFKIKTVTSIDDYMMMKEVLTRRFRRAIEEGQKFPDLVMIDGGLGHLSAAREALAALGLDEKIALCSIAKQNEDIFLPDRSDPAPLGKKSQGLFLLMRIRDEAHRFAITYHRKLRKGRMTLSILSDIDGLGQKRISALYDHFETIEKIRAASIEELNLVKSVTAPIAKKIYDYFRER